MTDTSITISDHRNNSVATLDARLSFIERLSDLVNPILVKEMRQAVKSRSFLWPFALMLIAALGWSYYSAARILSASGESAVSWVFSGFVTILSVPAIIFVPYVAYQGVGAERQNATLELVWITSLTGRQIVLGKFWAAVMQLISYLSALAPCVAFTYLLRGIDIISILLTLYYICLASAVLTSLAILLATVFRNAYVSVTMSAALLVLLVLAFFGLVSTIMSWIAFQNAEIPVDIASIHLCITTIAISFVVLFLYAAGAQLSFAGDNQSTFLRSVLLVQQTLFVFWLAYWGKQAGNELAVYNMYPFFGLYWAFMGSFMAGELALLSPRARRTLPRTALGRVFLTWLQPGSGTGYFFTLINLAGVMAFLALVCHWTDTQVWGECVPVGIAVWVSVAAYLGAARLIVLLINRFRPTGAVIGFAITGILGSLGAILPALIDELLDWRTSEPFWMWFSWVWVVSETWRSRLGADWFKVVFPMAVATVVIFLVNTRFTVHELAAGLLPQPVFTPWAMRPDWSDKQQSVSHLPMS